MSENQQDESSKQPPHRQGHAPRLADIAMLERWCQLWIQESRKGRMVDPEKTLEQIRYRLRVERKAYERRHRELAHSEKQAPHENGSPHPERDSEPSLNTGTPTL